MTGADAASFKELRDGFRALADTTRLSLMAEVAARGEVAVCDLARAARLSQPLVSWHLGILRRAGLITTRREGRSVYCSLCPAGIERCQHALAALCPAVDEPATARRGQTA